MLRKNILLLTTDGLCVKTICWNCTLVYFNLQWSKDYNGLTRDWHPGWLCCFFFQTLHQTNTSLHRTNAKMRDVKSCTQSKREDSCVFLSAFVLVFVCMAVCVHYSDMQTWPVVLTLMYRLKTSVCVCVFMCIFVCVSLCLCVRYSANITSRLDTYVYTKGSHQGALVTVMYTAWEDMMPLLMQFILI